MTDEENVRFIDGDSANLAIANLEIVTTADQIRLNGLLKGRRVTLICPVCKQEFSIAASHADRRDTCSQACRSNHRKFNPTRVDLQILVWTRSTEKVGLLFGVSGKAVEKRCKSLGIEKPPRGYWTKVAVGQIELDPALVLKADILVREILSKANGQNTVS